MLTHSTSSQLSYKRSSFSLHLPYLFLRKMEHPDVKIDKIDEIELRCFSPFSHQPHYLHYPHLYKGTLSVLLTLVVPETATTESGVPLLSLPEAMWTVLIVNTPSKIAGDPRKKEAPQFLTPLASFIRGICYTVMAHRMHIEQVLHSLKEQVNQAVSSATCS